MSKFKKQSVYETIWTLRSKSGKRFSDITDTVNALHGTDYKVPSVRRMYQEYRDTQNLKVKTIKRDKFLDNVPLTIDNPNVIVIPDVHLPFVADGYIEFLDRVRNEWKLDTTVCIGDVMDYNSISFWDSDPDGMSAKSEMRKTAPQLNKLSDYFPDMYICMGNHDARPQRLGKNAGLPSVMLRHPNEIIERITDGYAEVDGWKWNNSYILNNDTLFEHGEHSGLKATYDKALLTGFNVVQGHTHSYGGVMYINDGYNQRWALNVGCGINNKAYAFYYAKSHKMKPTLGCGIIVDGIPHFIPFRG